MACALYTPDQIDKATGLPKDGAVGIPLDNKEAVQRFILANAHKITPDVLAEVTGRPTEAQTEAPKGETKVTPVQKVRSLYERFANDDSKPQALRDAIAQADKYYEESSNKFTSQMADAMIEVAKDAGEIDALWEEATQIDIAALDPHIAPIKAMMATKIASYYETTGQLEKSAEAYGWMFRTSTNAGKIIQICNAQSHPEAILARAKYDLQVKKEQAMARKNTATGKTNKETIAEVHDIAAEGAKDATAKLANNERVGKAAKNTAEKKTKRESKQEYKERVKKDLKRATAILEEALGIKLSIDTDAEAQGLTIGNLINLIADAAVAAKTATETIEDAIDRVIDVLRSKGLLPATVNIDDIKSAATTRIANRQAKEDSRRAKEANREANKDKKRQEAEIRRIARELEAEARKQAKQAEKEAEAIIKKYANEKSAEAKKRIADAIKEKERFDKLTEDVVAAMNKAINKVATTDVDEVLNEFEQTSNPVNDFIKEQLKKQREARKYIKETTAEEYGTTLHDIVVKYYESADAFKGSLVDRLMIEGNLTSAEAREFARIVEQEYDKLLAETRAKIEAKIASVVPENANTLAAAQHKKLLQKINKALLTGKIDMKDFSDLFGGAMGFATMTAEQNQQLSDLKDALKIFPEGSTEYYKRVQKFNTFLDKVQLAQKSKFSRTLIHIGRVAKELFYNILSAPTTFYTNIRGILHTGVTLTGVTAMVKGAGNGNGTRLYLESMGRMMRGFQQGWPIFKQIMADGFNTQYASEESKQPITPMRALLAKPLKESEWYEVLGKAYYYLPAKMVRAFIATDALAKQGFREFYATVKAYDDLLTAGMKPKGADFWKRVHDLAQNNKADYDLFKEQAAVEAAGYKARGISIDKQFIGIRATELAQEARSADIAAYAELMAQRSTLNNKPEGTLGQVYDVMNLAQRVPAAYTVIPFIKIGINMVDTWLDWSPWGLKRAVFGRGIGQSGNKEALWNKYRIGKQGGKDWIDDQNMHLIRGAIGTAAMVYITLALRDLLDDDPEQGGWNIFQNVTANISNDPAAVDEARKKGFKPYTITLAGGFEFSYKESIIAPMLAWMGYSLDAKNFGDSKDKKSANKLMAENFVNASVFIKEQSFLQGMSDMFSVAGRYENLTSDKAFNKFGKFAVTTTKNIAYPKFYESLYRGYKTFYDMPVYRPQDFSDNTVDAITEQFSKNIPYFEDKIDNKIFDRMGYEVTEKSFNTFPIPFAQEDFVRAMQTMLDIKRDVGPAWKIVLDLDISTNYNISTTDANGNRLDTSQRSKLSQAVSLFVQKRVIDEADRLSKLEPEARQRAFNDFVSEGFKTYKVKFFGEEEIVPPSVITYTESLIKNKTLREATRALKE